MINERLLVFYRKYTPITCVSTNQCVKLNYLTPQVTLVCCYPDKVDSNIKQQY